MDSDEDEWDIMTDGQLQQTSLTLNLTGVQVGERVRVTHGNLMNLKGTIIQLIEEENIGKVKGIYNVL